MGRYTHTHTHGMQQCWEHTLTHTHKTNMHTCNKHTHNDPPILGQVILQLAGHVTDMWLRIRPFGVCKPLHVHVYTHVYDFPNPVMNLALVVVR